MFERVELGLTIEKEEWERRVASLRESLLEVQYQILRRAEFPVIVLVNGVDGAGKSETVRDLTEWMDPRHIRSYAVDAPNDEERERPPMWRFVRHLPEKGRIAIFFGNWYTAPIVERAVGDRGRKHFDRDLDRIRRFETMLVDEGALLVKCWFHLSKKAQRKRLNELASSKRTAYRVTDEEWEHFERYDRFRAVSEEAVRATDVSHARWTLVDGTDPRLASLSVGEELLVAMRARLEEAKAAHRALPKKTVAAKSSPKKASRSRTPRKLEEGVAETGELVLRALDLGRTLAKDDYESKIEKLQRELALLTRTKKFQGISPVLVFEGVDAAGKGGAIRRVTHAIDPRIYRVHPIAAPSDEEKAHPYLWRFYRHAPADGRFAIFDRSWYGRVLVERVEGFCSESDWRRAYGEINDFESELVDAGNVVVKFWLQISLEEQLRRFEERTNTPFKRFKIGPEDWRNREKWPLYEVAASEMIVRTNTEKAPWTLVEAENKYYARVKILKTVVDAIARVVG